MSGLQIKDLRILTNFIYEVDKAKNFDKAAYGMSYVVHFTDLHLLSSRYEYEGFVNGKVIDYLPALLTFDFVVLGGDDVDVTTARDYKEAVELNKVLMKMAYSEIPENNKMCLGNHNSMGQVEWCNPLLKLPNGRTVLILHSHLQKDYKRWSKYILANKKDPGFFKRRVLMPLIDKFDDYFPDGKFSREFMENVAKEAKLAGADIVICGHGHPKNVIHQKYDGIDIYMSPQGATVYGFLPK